MSSGFPQGLENRENRENNNGQGKVRAKSGNFVLKCRLPWFLLFLLIIENVYHGIHQYESAHVNFKEFLYFSLFSSVISAALNTIQISYGMSYFRHRDSSDKFTYDIARQSVVNKMVRKISLEVREKSGNFFSHFWWEPWSCLSSFPH